MLFHAGALWRLNEIGLLSELDRVSSVSGGSITSGVLGCNWGRLDFDGDGVARAFSKRSSILYGGRREDDRPPAILMGAFLPGMIADRLAGSYDRHSFGGEHQALPDRPRFVLNATNLQSGALWRFSKPYMADYRVGTVENPTVSFSVAVAASSAFSPILSLLRPKVDLAPMRPTARSSSPTRRSDAGPRSRMVASMTTGLETAWKRYRTILSPTAAVSTHRRHASARSGPSNGFGDRHDRQPGQVAAQTAGGRQLTHGVRKGAYWSIWSEVDDFGLPDSLEVPDDRAKKLAREATRLKRLDSALQERLANWGYAICDTAIRKFVRPGAPRPRGSPTRTLAYDAVGETRPAGRRPATHALVVGVSRYTNLPVDGEAPPVANETFGPAMRRRPRRALGLRTLA